MFELMWAYFGKEILSNLLVFAGTGITGYSGYMGYKAIFSKDVDYIKDWVRHIFIYGTTGSGKTTIALKLFHKFVNDPRRFGTFFISPDVKTTNRILSVIPDWREEDTVVINVTDKMPIGCNLAFSGDIKEYEIHLYADDIVEMIKHLYKDNAWGDLIEEGVRMSAMAILEYAVKTNDNVSLLDVIKFLKDEQYRYSVKGCIDNYFVKDYWDTYDFESNDYKKLMIRFRKPLVSPYILECLCQERNFDLIKAVNENKIIVLQLGGTLGEADSKLIASMFFSKFTRAVYSERIKVKSFEVFCDEIHLYLDLLANNFSTGLAVLRKFNIGLVLITQAIYQLSEKIKGAIELCNTKYVYRPTDKDIAALVKMFQDYDLKASTFKKLKTGQCMLEELVGGETKDPKKKYYKMILSSEYPTEKTKRIRELSRQKYGTPRHIVKNYIRDKILNDINIYDALVIDVTPDNIVPIRGGKKDDNRKGHTNTLSVSPFEVP